MSTKYFVRIICLRHGPLAPISATYVSNKTNKNDPRTDKTHPRNRFNTHTHIMTGMLTSPMCVYLGLQVHIGLDKVSIRQKLIHGRIWLGLL